MKEQPSGPRRSIFPILAACFLMAGAIIAYGLLGRDASMRMPWLQTWRSEIAPTPGLAATPDGWAAPTSSPIVPDEIRGVMNSVFKVVVVEEWGDISADEFRKEID